MTRLLLGLLLLSGGSACSHLDEVRLHYDSRENISARFAPGQVLIPGYAVWKDHTRGRVCDIYIIPPEDFPDLYPAGFLTKDGEFVETWDDLYRHEYKHCIDGYYHPVPF